MERAAVTPVMHRGPFVTRHIWRETKKLGSEYDRVLGARRVNVITKSRTSDATSQQRLVNARRACASNYWITIAPLIDVSSICKNRFSSRAFFSLPHSPPERRILLATERGSRGLAFINDASTICR